MSLLDKKQKLRDMEELMESDGWKLFVDYLRSEAETKAAVRDNLKLTHAERDAATGAVKQLEDIAQHVPTLIKSLKQTITDGKPPASAKR